MSKEQKLEQARGLLMEYRSDLAESESREVEWTREAAYYQRMAELHKDHRIRAAASVAWLEQIIQEIEVGKL